MMSPCVVLVCLFAIFLEVTSHNVKSVTHETNKSEDDMMLIDDHRFFLNEIFNKYGADGVMSFEGFEHLLENLGLGRLTFDKSHNVSVHHVNGSFLEVHDELELHLHNHDHETEAPGQRSRRGLEEQADTPELTELVHEPDEDGGGDGTVERVVRPPSWRRRCLSPQVILATYGLVPHHDVVISPVSFLHLCPAIVYELDQRSCNEVVGDLRVVPHDLLTQTSNKSAWQYASISVCVMSLAGILGVAVVPLVQRAIFERLLHFLVALAVGTLCGDALLHLLPHALESSDGPNGHTLPVLRAATAFGSMAFFFFVEAIIRTIRFTKDPSTENLDKESNLPTGEHVVELGPMLSKTDSPHSHHHNHQPPSGGGVSTVAWMVIMGDGLHNLTDGLAIGAAFAGGTVPGLATTLAVFCHELPHELGDFAVLLKSGMSVKRALFYNLVSSVLSFVGMVIGVWVGDHEQTAMWIYAGTAGIFLYIGLSDLVPEMMNVNGSRSLLDMVNQLAGILTGGGIMLVIALYEQNLQSIFN